MLKINERRWVEGDPAASLRKKTPPAERYAYRPHSPKETLVPGEMSKLPKKPETSIQVLGVCYKPMKIQPSHENVVLSLKYKSVKIQPAHRNMDSSTKLVLQLN